MKRALLFIFMTVCVLGMSACSSKDAMPETSDSASNPVQNTDISNLNGGKIWSEQDIVSMFSLVQETDWEYIDCVQETWSVILLYWVKAGGNLD